MKKLLLFLCILTGINGFSQISVRTQTTPTQLTAGNGTVVVRSGTFTVSGTPTVSIVNTATNVNVTSTITTGNVGGFTPVSSTTITMSVAGAYATGDYMGTSTTPQTFTNVCRSSGGTGIIKGIVVSDKIATANVDMELWLLNATFTAPTDNAAWAISDAEATTVIGIISLGSSGWKATANNQVYYDDSFSIGFDLPTGTSIYYALVARGTTPSFTSGDLAIGIIILQD